MSWIEDFIVVFVPLFVAMDAIGVLPIYMSYTESLTKIERKKLLREALLASLIIACVFLLVGKFVFSFLGITTSDFQIAGGLVLLMLAITDLAFGQYIKRRTPPTAVGIVPIGIPLVMGPAALTTILVLVEGHGYVMTAISLVINLAFVSIIFGNSGNVSRILGDGGSKAVAKVAALFLAAIAVRMIRVGLTTAISG